MTEINFTINWYEVAKAFGYIILGAGIIIALLVWIFKDWRPYQ